MMINTDNIYTQSKRALLAIQKTKTVRYDIREDCIQEGALALIQGNDPEQAIAAYISAQERV
jgi:hypothetical protein